VSDGGAPLRTSPCPVALPASWQHALDAGTLWHDADDQLPAGLPVTTANGTGVLHQQATPTSVRISVLGTGRRELATVGTLPIAAAEQGGISYASSDAHQLAFVYNLGTGEDQQNRWRLYLWDAGSGQLRVVATNPTGAGGTPVRGGWVHPLLAGGHLYWIQATPSVAGHPGLSPGSELRQYDLATGRTRTLYSGLTQSYLVYGDTVFFTALAGSGAPNPDGTPPLVLRAVVARTGAPAPVPAGLDAARDRPDFMVTDGDLVVWDTSDGGLRGWRPSWQRTVTLFPDLQQQRPAALADLGQPAMPRIYGHFLVWSDRQTYLLDLRTDSFVRLTPNHGVEDLAGSRLAMWQYATDGRPAAPGHLTGTAYLLDLAALPGLPGCGG